MKRRPQVVLVPKTTVVNRRTTAFDVYIGRPSVWGNPFSHILTGDRNVIMVFSREEAVRRYIEYLRNNPDLVERARKELAGKILGCWCKPAACHGDILARIANGEKL